MMTAMPDILTLITTRACVDTAEPGDLLDDLCLDPVDLWGLRDDIEHALGMIIPDSDFDKWRTVGDVLAVGRQAA